MALPTWITPAGQLGIVPELEYYEFPLDAYDASGGTLVYSKVSGRLPLGIQLTSTGKLQGIPVSELGSDQNVTYSFTIRIKNSITGNLSDRTFVITVTNVAPPIIIPRNVDLGIYLDGTIVNMQLEAIEFTPSALLTWRVKSGELPPGLSLSSSGLLSGYVEPIPDPAAGTISGWDNSAWSYMGWDFPLYAINKTFNFTVEVFDGVNYDVSTYAIEVFPKSSLTADNDELTVDTGTLNSGEGLSDIDGPRHNPIIITTQTDLVAEREGSYFSFHLDAIDLDGDVLQYTIPGGSSGAFDEEVLIGNGIPYIASTLVGGNLYVGVSSLENPSKPALVPGDAVQVLSLNAGQLEWYDSTITSFTKVRLTGNTKIVGSAGDFITQAISGANATISSITATTGTIAFGGNILVGSLTISGNTNVGTLAVSDALITANVGQFITQNGSTANATVRANVINSATVPITLTVGGFTNGSGIIKINGSNIAAYPTYSSFDDRLISANVGDFITQVGTTANAVVTGNVTSSVVVPVHFTAGIFTLNSIAANIKINGTDISVYPTARPAIAIPVAVSATLGDTITQPLTGATASVISSVTNTLLVPVTFLSGIFSSTAGITGNILVGGTNILAHPIEVIAHADVAAIYNTSSVFTLNSTDPSAITYINAVSTTATPTSVVSVGVTLGSLSVEGTNGFSEVKFDQGALTLPLIIPNTQVSVMDINSGWMTGFLPTQTINQIDYDFEIVVYKKDYPEYVSSRLYKLTILGDLNNRIDWITPSDLGTIENGRISDLFVSAISTKGKTLNYTLTSDAAQRLPQGLMITSTGLLSGRVSFELFNLDAGKTLIDGDILGISTTTFDNTYTFTITAYDMDQSVAADRTFTIRVLNRNITPYEDLYLKALPSIEQRAKFQTIMQNTTVFPPELIYRNEDPFFGLAPDIKTLFLSGLSPSTLAEYTAASSTNHFNKRITVDGVKTAVALDSNFNVKYEVVYLSIIDDNTNASGQGPSDSINLEGQITPYYDEEGIAYTTAYPNAFSNMKDAMVNSLGYANKGALPDWMTSRQPNGLILGFTRAIVLAYTVPGASDLVAYRYQQQNVNLNEIDFTVDRYQLDNSYSDNYDVAASAFVTSTETTFDRYPGLSSVFDAVGTVDYAVTIAFEEINKHSVTYINSVGGMDGIKHFKDGETLVFAVQEFRRDQNDLGDYNQGWNDIIAIWDGDAWDYDLGTVPTTDDLGWDASTYVPGYNEHNFDPLVANERIGVWQISIGADTIVTLNFVQEIIIYNKLFVRDGFTHGGTNIYYDPIVKSGNLIPDYSIIPEQIKIVSTRFDGNGTRFYDYRDSYSVPESGDKYIKFSKLGVFN
jgi:hypothetical protein